MIADMLEAIAVYGARRGGIREFIAWRAILKRGIALTRVKFGI